jgi:ketosteroid isomerase-like protein
MTPATSSKEVARQIRALDAAFMKFARARDAEGLTDAFYAEDAEVLAPGTPMIRGKAAIRDFWTGFLQVTGPDMRIESEHIAASGDMAYCVGRYDGELAGTRQQGKFAVVFRRQADGGYKAIADIFNADHS